MLIDNGNASENDSESEHDNMNSFQIKMITGDDKNLTF